MVVVNELEIREKVSKSLGNDIFGTLYEIAQSLDAIYVSVDTCRTSSFTRYGYRDYTNIEKRILISDYAKYDDVRDTKYLLNVKSDMIKNKQQNRMIILCVFDFFGLRNMHFIKPKMK